MLAAKDDQARGVGVQAVSETQFFGSVSGPNKVIQRVAIESTASVRRQRCRFVDDD